jgi:heavy metal translocating P-type ATPase
MQRIFNFIDEERSASLLVVFVFTVLVASGVLWINENSLSQPLLKYALVLGSLPLWWSILKDMWKRSFGVDLIAGVALVGTFVTGQYLAGMVILLMLSGGQLLEKYAMNRAKHELSSLLSNASEFAHLKVGDTVRDVPLEEVLVGVTVLVKSGEIIPVDGMVLEGTTVVDESTLTGESLPVDKTVNSHVYAGTQNVSGSILVRVSSAAKETRFQTIVDLVKSAQNSKAPIVRLADKYSVYFTIYTVVVALIAWFVSHDLVRVVAVLVVATPCPLILATPIAIMSGMSNASKHGVIVKDGGALETLAKSDTFVFDKTGTVTLGTPEVVRVVTFSKYTEEEILKISSSLDQLSTHVLALALQQYTKKQNISLNYPSNFQETFGDGVRAELDNTTYFLGKKTFVLDGHKENETSAQTLYTEVSDKGQMIIFLSNESEVLGAILFQDIPRPEAANLFKKLKDSGIKNLLMLTGDKESAAKEAAEALGITFYVSECLPDDKLSHIQEFQKKNSVVTMVGDGINDAPALAGADVGIALGTHGKTATSEVADMVILSQSVEKVYTAKVIAQKTIQLAKQSIFVGIGASAVAMIFSMLGLVPPLTGALLQEGIDVLVILNALRLSSILDERSDI